MLALSSEDTFVQLSTQLVNDRFRVIYGRVIDIYALVQRGLRWDMVLEIARSSGAAGAVYLSGRLASLLGAEIPEQMNEDLLRLCPKARIAAAFLTDLRWPLGRYSVPSVAKTTLIGRLCSPGQRLVGGASPVLHASRGSQAREARRLSLLAARAYFIVKAVCWRFGFGIMTGAAAVGAQRLQCALRDSLWSKTLALGSVVDDY